MFFDDFSFMENADIFMGKGININDDGYLYGNMFKDEYKPYKNYSVYKLKAGSEKQKLKLKIMEETFIINDLNLYLDLNSDDKAVYEYFTKHEKLLNKYIEEYQDKYGSICLNSQNQEFNWVNGPWPWEDKDV